MDDSGDKRIPSLLLLDELQPINLLAEEVGCQETASEAFRHQQPRSFPPAINTSMAARVLGDAKDAPITFPEYHYTPLPSRPPGMFRLLLLACESKAAEPQRPHTKPFENTRSSASPKFRLQVEAEPRPNPKQLMARLIPYQLEGSHPPYTALSWAWGDRNASRSKSIRIWENGPQGKSKAKSIGITKTLDGALRELREPEKDIYLWVDALCIDQESFEEKEAQMKMMDKFYTNAAKTCVWLGPFQDRSGAMPSFIKNILRLEGIDDLVCNIDSVQNWVAFSKLIRREWFTRRCKQYRDLFSPPRPPIFRTSFGNVQIVF